MSCGDDVVVVFQAFLSHRRRATQLFLLVPVALPVNVLIRLDGSWPTLVNRELLRLRGEKICDRLPSRRTRLTVLTEKRGRDGRKPIAPPSRRDAD